MKEILKKIRRRIQLYNFRIRYFASKELIVKKVDSIIKKKNKFNLIKELSRVYKNHPLIKYHLAREYVSTNSNYEGFKHLKKFENFRVEWLKKNNKNYKEIFIPLQQVIGSLGNFYSLYYFIINNNYIVKNKLKLVLILKETEKYSNYFLFNFFKPFLTIYKNNKIFYDNYFLSRINKAPIEVALPYKKFYYPPGIAINLINSFLYKKNLFKKVIFKIKDKNTLECKNKLEKYGLRKHDWFVVLHVRENKLQKDKLRNSDPITYLDAIKFIISKGGKVVRVGDKNMTKLPITKGLIDYPFTNLKSEIMDVYLASKCKFCMGTSSGYYSLPIFFGKPVLLVNYLNTLEFFSLRKQDLFLPKKLIDKKTNKLIDPILAFGPKIGNFTNELIYKVNNIEIQNNTSEEILYATKEMFNLLSNKFDKKLEMSNKKFYNFYNNKYKKKFSHKMQNFGKISYSYLINFYK